MGRDALAESLAPALYFILRDCFRGSGEAKAPKQDTIAIIINNFFMGQI